MLSGAFAIVLLGDFSPRGLVLWHVVKRRRYILKPL